MFFAVNLNDRNDVFEQSVCLSQRGYLFFDKRIDAIAGRLAFNLEAGALRFGLAGRFLELALTLEASFLEAIG